MRRLLGLAALVGLTLAILPDGRAAAGPWPRGEGRGFLAVSLAGESTARGAGWVASAWFERGLAPRLTFAAGARVQAGPGGGRAGEAGLVWSLVAPGGPLALSAGLSLVQPRAGAVRLRPALHLGRGFTRPLGGGWVRLALAAELPLDGGAPALDAMAQAGIRAAGGRGFAMLTGSAHRAGGALYLKLAPALGRELGSGRTLVAEYSHEFGHDRARRLTLALWMAF